MENKIGRQRRTVEESVGVIDQQFGSVEAKNCCEIGLL